jgi:hypothetical protein
LKLFLDVDIDVLSNEPLHITFGFPVDELERF